MASEQLIWEVTKTFNAYLRKGPGTGRSGRITLAAEPANLTHTHSYAHSGIARAKAVTVSADAKGIVLGLNVSGLIIWDWIGGSRRPRGLKCVGALTG